MIIIIKILIVLIILITTYYSYQWSALLYIIANRLTEAVVDRWATVMSGCRAARFTLCWWVRTWCVRYRIMSYRRGQSRCLLLRYVSMLHCVLPLYSRIHGFLLAHTCPTIVTDIAIDQEWQARDIWKNEPIGIPYNCSLPVCPSYLADFLNLWLVLKQQELGIMWGAHTWSGRPPCPVKLTIFSHRFISRSIEIARTLGLLINPTKLVVVSLW